MYSQLVPVYLLLITCGHSVPLHWRSWLDDMSQPQRPLVLPEPFDGTGTWLEWVAHFENVAIVNNWVNADDKLKWLRVRLTGKAQTAFMRFPEATRNNFGEAIVALNRRFNPDSKRELYVAELQSRKKRKDEDWASFGDALKVLADKAYPDLEENARERLALNQFLAELGNPQIAFGVKQKRPKTAEDAVVSTIELESYLTTADVQRVSATVPLSDSGQECNAAALAVVTPRADNYRGGDSSLTETLKALNERLSHLELRMDSEKESPRQSVDAAQRRKGSATTTCWSCGRKGHIARFCRSRGAEQQSGNSRPWVVKASHSRDNA